MDFLQLLILAIIFVLMGIALDSLIRYLLKETDASPKKNPKPTESNEDRIPEGFITEARILRDVGRRMAVQAHGKLYRSASEVEAEQRLRLNALSDDFSGWLERPHPISQPAPTSGPVPIKPEIILEPESQIQKPSLNPVNLLMNAIQTDVRPIERPQSLAEQVDAVLQDLLKTSPIKGRGVHLTEAPDHSLVVIVGMEKYPGIEAVPDEEIRQVIRSAAEEWRKRQSVGR